MLEGTGRVEPLSGSRIGRAAGVGEEAGAGATPSVGDDLVEGRDMLILCKLSCFYLFSLDCSSREGLIMYFFSVIGTKSWNHLFVKIGIFLIGYRLYL